jgi:uncharacterized damage-inducible protein DinB
MPAPLNLRDALLRAWETNNRVNIFLVERLPADLWQAPLPGLPRRTVRTIAAHIHNARCRWIKTLGRPHGIAVPRLVDPYRVKPPEVAAALERSGAGIRALLELGFNNGGSIPPTPAYTWRNLPLDVAHVLAYFAAHEGHHRGQIVMLARQSGHRLPTEVTGGIWQWTRLSKAN